MGRRWEIPSFSGPYLQECPIRFFLHLEEGSRYIDVFVEDYSVVIIAKPGNGRVSAHCWRYVSILGYAILFVLHPAGPLEHSILCNYCINFKR